RGALAAIREALLCRIKNAANFLDPNRGGIDLLEMALAVTGDQTRERRLSGSGRAVKNDAGNAVGLEHPAEQFALAQEMLLADELIERARAHAHRQRRDLTQVFLAGLVKEVHVPIIEAYTM